MTPLTGKGGLAELNAQFPLSDPCYDAPVVAGLAGMAPGRACALRPTVLPHLASRRPVGSNEWAVGAQRSLTGRALLANDPHLGLGIPGVWYLVDLHAPGMHAAGAVFPGSPGVVLGHNQYVAWGATDSTVASLSVFHPPARTRSERLANGVVPRTVCTAGDPTLLPHAARSSASPPTTAASFSCAGTRTTTPPRRCRRSWHSIAHARSKTPRVRSQAFPGPTHNFAVADTTGRAAYVMAGAIPNDPVWARWFHPAADLAKRYGTVARSALPRVAPSLDGIVWTANNKPYAAGFPLQLSPQFAAPYRAYRIAQLLRARPRYDVAYFAQMQMDALSLPERELARDLSPSIARLDAATGRALAGWDGQMTGDSTTATLAEELRVQLTGKARRLMPVELAIGQRAPQSLHVTVPSSLSPWSVAGAVTPQSALSSLGMTFLDGTRLPGFGDAFALHVQYAGYSQSFRAVWDVGNWEAGGIILPQGESGEPGSGHYTDEAGAWLEGRLWPLPFSDAAVQSTAVQRETLTP